MGQLFVILMRILFPRDPVARCRELMRVWLRRVMDAALDPEEVESFAYWSEDRAKLEGAICFLEYFMRVLTYGRPPAAGPATRPHPAPAPTPHP